MHSNQCRLTHTHPAIHILVMHAVLWASTKRLSPNVMTALSSDKWTQLFIHNDCSLIQKSSASVSALLQNAERAQTARAGAHPAALRWQMCCTWSGQNERSLRRQHWQLDVLHFNVCALAATEVLFITNQRWTDFWCAERCLKQLVCSSRSCFACSTSDGSWVFQLPQQSAETPPNHQSLYFLEDERIS